jgi:hypothetical protein
MEVKSIDPQKIYSDQIVISSRRSKILLFGLIITSIILGICLYLDSQITVLWLQGTWNSTQGLPSPLLTSTAGWNWRVHSFTCTIFAQLTTTNGVQPQEVLFQLNYPFSPGLNVLYSCGSNGYLNWEFDSSPIFMSQTTAFNPCVQDTTALYLAVEELQDWSSLSVNMICYA